MREEWENTWNSESNEWGEFRERQVAQELTIVDAVGVDDSGVVGVGVVHKVVGTDCKVFRVSGAGRIHGWC